jgi:hypothetical protein
MQIRPPAGLTHSDHAREGEPLRYCDVHAYWRRKTHPITAHTTGQQAPEPRHGRPTGTQSLAPDNRPTADTARPLNHQAKDRTWEPQETS